MNSRVNAFLAAWAASVSIAAAAESSRPNIVYIVVDNVTFEHMGEAYGGENVTPAMDSIAVRGVRFARPTVRSWTRSRWRKGPTRRTSAPKTIK